MVEKFQNKYRIPSTRLSGWNYSWGAAYFVTLCTQNRECFFGNIVNDEMHLSEIGQQVKTQWMKTFELREDMNLQMGEWVIMPNHFHAIIVIGENKYNTQGGTKRRDAMHVRDAMHCVSTSKNQFGPQSKNLASIIRGFKSAVTINARRIHADFAWQPRYHDHIIRNHKSLQGIAKYIRANPEKWGQDKFFNINREL